MKIKKLTRLPAHERVYDLTVQGNANLFVCDEISQKPILAHNCARDNPNQMFKVEVVGGVVDRARREELHEKLQRADKDFGVTLKVKEQPVKVFKRLIPTKLCPDREFYDDFIDDKYNPCPLHKVCFGSKLRPKLKLAIKEAASMEDE